MENLGSRIREERLARGLSQTELAELAEVSLNFISQLELGKVSVQMDKVFMVLSTLGLEMKITYRKTL